MTTRITTDNITDATIGTADLASSVPLNTQWQAVKTSDFTAVAGEGYFVNTTSAAVEVTLPASPSAGDTIVIKDYAGTFATNNLTIGRNSENIQGVANDSSISTNRASVTLVYVDATKGWLYTVESNVASLGSPPGYVAATGGTITTSGDYKIHAFIGDGCFVVSNAGNPAGSTVLDYFVVAGGGAGSRTGGGGGAGGFRVSNQLNTCGASPLASSTGIQASVTTYPVTVGGGGAAQDTDNIVNNSGSNSVFSTITSAGGGGGHSYASSAPGIGANGGSGGGGGTADGTLGGPAAGGSGNTPPVSPPQGNSGGNGSPTRGGGAGGGAGAAGGNSPGNNNGGAGGIGSFVPTDWTSSLGESGPSGRYFAGGGSGTQPSGTVAGGLGGGGDGGPAPGTPGKTGVANTGGGGGGANDSGASTNGGKGIVLIRYKFQ